MKVIHGCQFAFWRRLQTSARDIQPTPSSFSVRFISLVYFDVNTTATTTTNDDDDNDNNNKVVARHQVVSDIISRAINAADTGTALQYQQQQQQQQQREKTLKDISLTMFP